MADTKDVTLAPGLSPRSRSPDAHVYPNGNPKPNSKPILPSPLRAALSTNNETGGDALATTQNGIGQGVPATHSQITKSSNDVLPHETQTGSYVDNHTNDLPKASGSTPIQALEDNNALPATPPIQKPADGFMGTLDSQNDTPGASRRSVQFVRDTHENDQVDGSHSKTPSLRGDRPELLNRHQTLYSKLKALAASPTSFAHSRSTSAPSFSSTPVERKIEEGEWPPRVERNEPYFPMMREESGSEVDADAEESAPERDSAAPASRKKRKKSRRTEFDGISTAPASPHSTRPGLFSTHSMITSDSSRPYMLPRSATFNDASTQDRQHVSEDEGRHRLNQENSSRMKTAWRGLSHTGTQRKNNEGTPEGRRPMHLRALTNRDKTTNGSGQDPRRRAKPERGSSLSAQRWRQIKQKLVLLGQSKKKERTIDHEKSAELLAELIAGSPAALIAASMFQRDEHGCKRIPILLEQLKLRVTDSEVYKSKEQDNPTPGDRHLIFRIELEYGNGVNRMSWMVKRSLRDFVNLHLKYKLYFSARKYVKRDSTDEKEMPQFPRGAFPYLKGIRGLEDEGGEDDDDAGNDTEGGGTTDTDRPAHKSILSRRPSLGITRRTMSTGRRDSHTGGGTPGKRDTFPERQRKKLELYLQKMIKFMLFRPEGNRLCKFLEVSALGMRLAAEGSYHGKEGFLAIQSSKGLDFRKALTPSLIKNRHSPKWFLVRHSYVVCVDSPEEMNIYDVFLFDSDFQIQPQKWGLLDTSAQDLARTAKKSAAHPQHHRLKLQNSERKMKLLARNDRQLQQFEESIRAMYDISPWAKKNRFDSFAPVRTNCFAQWLVDGRDHMWVVSRAINQAKDVIYIHDWWLSPEIYMRRPPAISQKWRLDRLLKRKAEQGVKIFVIVYRNIESAVPIDSQYTKFSLLDLHHNVFVQRSPNQFRQNTFFWAHHEKLCIIDHTLAFVGGIDLCFGRWDTPQHAVVDDKQTGFEVSKLPKDADHCQLWPGKDYSNPRVQDFYSLNKPYEEMYDRAQVARMPWHDISMQVVGQPARDLTRHFVQRWNYILRQRKPTRPTPFLLPPPDFDPADLEALGLDGTCEVQILRSAGPWSLGTPDKTEHSIMNAYVKMIEDSEHFVYIENQFFISSCETEVTTINNLIGDALVERIVRAAKNEETWRACIVIPLMPGFQNTVEQEGGTSVRLIMQYQYRSICRGESSMFGRLRAQGIEPEDYVQFYSLRTWGKIGPKKNLVSEQLYIHAKCMVVDDRVAIIGSANINERSMLGNRDSECASIVRDTDMIDSRMAGKPYKVGRFPHTLRMRLMREHLGLDVDKIMEDAQAMETSKSEESRDRAARSSPGEERDVDTPLPSGSKPEKLGQSHPNVVQAELREHIEEMHSFNHDVDWEQENNPNLRTNRKVTEDSRVTGNSTHREDVAGQGFDKMTEIQEAGYGVGRDTAIVKGNKEVLVSDIRPEGKATLRSPLKHDTNAPICPVDQRLEASDPPLPPRPAHARMNTEKLGLPMLSQLPPLPSTDDTDIGGPVIFRATSKGSDTYRHPLVSEIKCPMVDKDVMQDPLNDVFIYDTWRTIAENNTKIYRAVFRCMPDNEVKNWKEYKEYLLYAERFKQLQGGSSFAAKGSGRTQSGSISRSGPPGAGISDRKAQLAAIGEFAVNAEKKVDEIKDIIHPPHEEKETAEQPESEKEKLMMWAADANRAQQERQGRPLTQDGTFDEKVGLKTVPETVTRSSSVITGPGDEVRTVADDTSTTTEQLRSDQSTSTFPTLDREKTRLPQFVGYSEALNMNAQPVQKRRRRATTKGSRREFQASDDIPSLAEAEELLNLVQGNLVVFPYDWLEKVEAGGNWLYPLDQISPIEIYV